MAQVRMEGVSRRYGEVRALEALDLTVVEGEFLSLLGPSGCGKTTTLRLIAGFLLPSDGRILIGDDDVTLIPPQKRQIGMVFQDYALFPHLNVEENIGFGLRERGVPRARIKARVEELLNLIRLPDIGRRYPAELSGGQCQRVAVARAVAYPPRVLLMDEPLGALDLKMRENMQVELRRLQKELGITTIYVTHDQSEAMTMSDRIAVMDGGRLVQLDAPVALYRHPRTRFVAEFVGNINLLSGRIVDRVDDWFISELGAGRIRVRGNDSKPVSVGARVTAAIRPEHLTLVDDKVAPNGLDYLAAEVIDFSFTGNLTRVNLVLADGSPILAECRSDVGLPAPGQALRIGWNPEQAVILED